MQNPPSTYRRRLLFTGLTAAAVLVLLATGRVTSNPAGSDDASGEIERLIRRLPYPEEDAVSIQTSPDGDVWVTTRHGITRFDGGSPGRPTVLLDPERYRERFRRRMQPLSATSRAPGSRFRIGTRGPPTRSAPSPSTARTCTSRAGGCGAGRPRDAASSRSRGSKGAW